MRIYDEASKVTPEMMDAALEVCVDCGAEGQCASGCPSRLPDELKGHGQERRTGEKNMRVEDTLKQRSSVHGDYVKQSNLHDELLALIEPYMKKLKPQHRQALNAICMKISRILVGDDNFPDHWHDIGGYAKLGEESCTYVDPNQQELKFNEHDRTQPTA